MDSPLSNIDTGEVIADSEDEGLQSLDNHKDSLNDNSPENHSPTTTTRMSISLHLPQDQPHVSHQVSSLPVEPQIDYFAGFEDDRPAPSIAERAKMRPRKPVVQPTIDVFELTDEDEFTLRPQATKPKAKRKDKAKRIPTVAPDTMSDTTSPLRPTAPDNAPLVNARLKIRPRPAKKPPVQSTSPIHRHRPSESTLPAPTSLLHQSLPFNTPPTSELPPSDPVSSNLFTTGKGVHLPPIEFLPAPPTTDSGSSLSSSFPGTNCDDIYTPTKRHKKVPATRKPFDQPADDQAPLIPPPPTFFAGSSSSPLNSALTSRVIAGPQTAVVDPTDLPPTTAGSVAAIIGTTNAAIKLRKEKKRTETNDGIGKKERKGKGKDIQVLVPPPPGAKRSSPAPSKSKKIRKRKEIVNNLLEEDEDELNIGASHDIVHVTVSDQPSSPTKIVPNPLFIASASSAPGSGEVLNEGMPKPNRRNSRKRKSTLTETQAFPTAATPPSKKKKPFSTSGEQNEGHKTTFPISGSPEKRKEEEEETWNKNDDYPAKRSRASKGKGKMVVMSDSEDDVQPAADETRLTRSHPATKKTRGKKVSEGNEGELCGNKTPEEDNLKDERNQVQLTDATIRLPAPSIAQRCETPSASKYPSITSKYTIAPRVQTPSMFELIRRVNSIPGSPFPVGTGRGSPIPRLAYSPYLKSSRQALSKIAPLHPNRRTPPLRPPAPPPKKKSKKELDMEEKWEEEIIEEIGGITEWLALSENDKKELRRIKRDKEMGYCD